MHSTVVVLLAMISIVSSEDAQPHLPHYTIYKSFPSALAECAQYYELSSCSLNRIVQESYPNEPNVRRLIRCALINVRSWNDTTGVQEQVMNSYFNPTPEDTCYLNRTRDCIERSRQLPGGDRDVQTRAYDAFICYYRQYGNLNETEQFLPFTDEESDQLMISVLSITEVSQEALVQFSEGNILDNKEFPAVLYTLYVRVGFYQDRIVPQHLYIQFGNPELLSPQTEQCIEAAVNSLPCEADDKDQVYRIFRNCLVGITRTLELTQSVSRQLLGLEPFCGNGDSGSSTNAPCAITASPASTSQAPYYNTVPR